MVSLQVESWAALAPGLETREDWENWLQHPEILQAPIDKKSLKQIPPMLRRRFSTLGKCAVGATFQVLKDGESIPSIFSSRHGDTALTLSLLKSMGQDEPMSPTGFSLAVHNAVSGLFSIVRKDTSEVTSIASMEGLVLNTLLEAIGQLQSTERVLCVIYDIPLPELYRRYTASDAFPYAIAIILSHKEGDTYNIEQGKQAIQTNNSSLQDFLDTEPLRFIELLSGISTEMESELNGVTWRITKVNS